MVSDAICAADKTRKSLLANTAKSAVSIATHCRVLSANACAVPNTCACSDVRPTIWSVVNAAICTEESARTLVVVSVATSFVDRTAI